MESPGKGREVWLKLSPTVSISVPYGNAIHWDADDFARVYLASVGGAKATDARAWGERQVAEREDGLGG